MLTGLTHAHSFLRWVLLIMLIMAIVKAFQGKSRGGEYKLADGKFFMLTMVLTHVQILLGIGLFFMSDLVTAAMTAEGGMMKNSISRFWGMEHAVGMILAAVLITIGHSKSKKMTDTAKRYGKVAWFYIFGLLLILLSIPWPFRNVGVVSWF